FTDGICPYCGGIGHTEVAVTETIRLRLYWNKRDWIKLASNIQVPEAAVMSSGFLSDMDKCVSCERAVFINEQSELTKYTFSLASEPFPHGFGKDKYFIAY